jgi:hypothetical protein
MPRVAPSTHYKRHLFLRTAWLEFPKLYALLPLRAQWQVHEFYQPSEELTKGEFVARVKELANTKPALVHQAGNTINSCTTSSRLSPKNWVFRVISGRKPWLARSNTVIPYRLAWRQTTVSTTGLLPSLGQSWTSRS